MSETVEQDTSHAAAIRRPTAVLKASAAEETRGA
jgi:hypothetical protein